MEYAFPWPMSQGEWLAWSVAAVTLLFGLLMLFAPRLMLRALRLQASPNHPEAVGEARATISGFYIGVGMACTGSAISLGVAARAVVGHIPAQIRQRLLPFGHQTPHKRKAPTFPPLLPDCSPAERQRG